MRFAHSGVYQARAAASDSRDRPAAAGLAVEVIFPDQTLGAERRVGRRRLARRLDGGVARTLGHGNLNDGDEHAC